MTRAWLAAAVVAAACLVSPAVVDASTAHASQPKASQAPGSPPWVGTWAASPEEGTASSSVCPAGSGGFENKTVRNIVYTSVGGDEVRVRLSNTFGTAPLTIGSASVALDEIQASTVPGSMRRLRFGGSTSVTIPAGSEVLSDPVRLRVHAQQDLAVSAYVPSMTGPATYHQVAMQTSWVSGDGDHATSGTSTDYPQPINCWMFADGVEVPGSAHVTGSVIAFGDSITDGNQSDNDANARWPNVLARRLDAVAGPTMSVVDEGISGNMLLTDQVGSQGQSGLHRLGRDVIGQPGAKAVIMLLGTNDIRYTDVGQDSPPATAASIINGYKQVIARVHAAGLRIIGATITPFLTLPVPASGWQDAAGEAMREKVNHWILTSHAFDGIVDFSSAVASPYDHRTLNPVYDSGDYLHPDDAGYQVMGDRVPLSLLLGDNR
ncbi:MAG: SGNH/GDSL hydrolase family protein [Nocardiopsaceae bacterium]|nr:SGNH/GDSL hydrolase family protein [Nocardiopsaceae bacterium]